MLTTFPSLLPHILSSPIREDSSPSSIRQLECTRSSVSKRQTCPALGRPDKKALPMGWGLVFPHLTVSLPGGPFTALPLFTLQPKTQVRSFYLHFLYISLPYPHLKMGRTNNQREKNQNNLSRDMISHKVLSFFFLLFTSDVNYFSGCCAKSQMPRTEKGKLSTTFPFPRGKT